MDAMRFGHPDDVKAITPLNPFGRSKDGRPMVPEELLERMKQVTTEEAWGVLKDRGYDYQFEGNWVNLHPERVMVGRAITAIMVPVRPDLNDVVEAVGKVEGRHGTQNNWVIHTVGKDDVVIVDLFGKLRYGTFVGDNLSTAVRTSGGAGLVIDGGIRDTQRVFNLPDINVFCRGFDPTPLREVTLISLNGPARIGHATVLPGDVVLGTREGVIFIPPHLVEEVLASSQEVRIRDQFVQQRMAEGKYSSGQIDMRSWTPEIEADYQEWKKAYKR
jgi:regulator of RNase E activity RraA